VGNAVGNARRWRNQGCRLWDGHPDIRPKAQPLQEFSQPHHVRSLALRKVCRAASDALSTA
jgi:hypothetical protein